MKKIFYIILLLVVCFHNVEAKDMACKLGNDLQKCVNNVSEGDNVILDIGEYILDQPLHMPKGVSLIGKTSTGTIIKTTKEFDKKIIIQVGVYGYNKIQSLQIINNSTLVENAIKIFSSDNELRDLYIKDVYGVSPYGIYDHPEQSLPEIERFENVIGNTIENISIENFNKGAIFYLNSNIKKVLINKSKFKIDEEEENNPKERIVIGCKEAEKLDVVNKGSISAYPYTCGKDQDGDGFVDIVDNCPMIPNKDQNDINKNGIGDICDPEQLSQSNLVGLGNPFVNTKNGFANSSFPDGGETDFGGCQVYIPPINALELSKELWDYDKIVKSITKNNEDHQTKKAKYDTDINEVNIKITDAQKKVDDLNTKENELASKVLLGSKKQEEIDMIASEIKKQEEAIRKMKEDRIYKISMMVDEASIEKNLTSKEKLNQEIEKIDNDISMFNTKLELLKQSKSNIENAKKELDNNKKELEKTQKEKQKASETLGNLNAEKYNIENNYEQGDKMCEAKGYIKTSLTPKTNDKDKKSNPLYLSFIDNPGTVEKNDGTIWSLISIIETNALMNVSASVEMCLKNKVTNTKQIREGAEYLRKIKHDYYNKINEGFCDNLRDEYMKVYNYYYCESGNDNICQELGIPRFNNGTAYSCASLTTMEYDVIKELCMDKLISHRKSISAMIEGYENVYNTKAKTIKQTGPAKTFNDLMNRALDSLAGLQTSLGRLSDLIVGGDGRKTSK